MWLQLTTAQPRSPGPGPSVWDCSLSFLWLVAMALTLLLPSPVLADDAATRGGGGARVDVYTDGEVTVQAPQVRVTAPVGDKASFTGGYLVNIISGATPVLTVDIISSATEFSDVRHALDLSVTGSITEHSRLGGSYAASLESDYISHGPGITVSTDISGGMTTLTAGYRLSFERVGAASRQAVLDHGHGHEFDFSWVQILGRRTRLNLLLSLKMNLCGELLGCHANPYRYVAVRSDDGGLVAVREHHPDQRARLAVALRLSQALATNLALHGGYRFYIDSWQVSAHTADLSLSLALLQERLMLRTTGRFTWQSAASFYRDSYVGESGLLTVPSWRTGDRELSGLWDVMVSGQAELNFFSLGPFARLSPSIRVSHTWYRYPNYSELPYRNAWLIGGGLDVSM